MAKNRASLLPAGYGKFLEDIKQRVRAAQVRATLSASRELIALYWDIGKGIIERQRAEGWGKAVVERLAKDLQKEFPGITGFSSLNVWRMRAFYLAWTADLKNLSQPVTDSEIEELSHLVTEIPWGHNIVLIHKVRDPVTRVWYARKTLEYGWSRAILMAQIESRLHKREARRSPILPLRCLLHSQTSLNKSSRTHTSSTSSPSLPRHASASWNRDCSTTSRDSCSKWVWGSPLWGGRFTLK